MPGSAESYEVAPASDLGMLVKAAALEAAEEPDTTTTATIKSVWRHADASPVVLLSMLLDRYGQKFLTWLPETLKLTLERDGLAVSNSNWTKIMAIIPLMTSPTPWRRWEVFHWTALGLSGTVPNFTYLEEPRLGHLVNAVNVMKVVDPPREFGEEVEKFIAATFRLEAVFYAPAPLTFAQRELEGTQLHCENCHALHRDDGELKCITCGQSRLRRVPFEFAELRDATKQLWDTISSLPLAEAVARLPHDNVGNAVYALATNWDWARDQKRAMAAQLRMLRT